MTKERTSSCGDREQAGAARHYESENQYRDESLVHFNSSILLLYSPGAGAHTRVYRLSFQHRERPGKDAPGTVTD